MSKKRSLTTERAYYKPFDYPEFYDIWLKHEMMHWHPREINFTEDIKDWQSGRVTKDEKEHLTQLFRFFTQSDIDVGGAYAEHYLPHFKVPEVRMMLSGFIAREAIHIDAYSHLIETLGLPETTYKAFLDYEEMRAKHDYIHEFKTDSVRDIARNIAVFSAFTEGMQLFSSFIMLLNFSRRGLMKGMGKIISWSVADESLHTDAMIKLFRVYIEENRAVWKDDLKQEIYSVAEKMVELEDKFIDLAYKVGDMEGLTADEVKQYIRYIADRRLIALGLKGIFKVKKNPLPWVDEILNAKEHSNFFENHSSEYAKGALTGSWSDVWGSAKEQSIT